MSKDYKLGILFGLLVLAAGVVYWVALDKPQSDSQTEAQQQDESTKVQVVDETTAPPPTTTVVEEQITTVAEEPAPGDVAPIGVAPVTPAAPTDPTAATPTAATNTIPNISNISSDSVEAPASGFILAEDADEVLTADDPIIEPIPIPDPQPVDLHGKSQYTVQQGDNGFFVVSKRVYGTTKYWKLIANANPGVRSTALRVGMKLKIPPKPTETVAAETTPVIPAHAQGKTYTDATGRKIYVITTSDSNGFSGISKKVYNTPKHWKLIADANPGVDTTRLKPGMKLIIPPVETARLTVPVAPRSGAQPGQIVTVNGQRFYIVKPGDAGFDYIAKKVYGSARYGKLIQNANPNASSTTLMPRDKLRIPPKPAGPPPGTANSSARSATTPAPHSPRPVTRDSSRPYFGN